MPLASEVLPGNVKESEIQTTCPVCQTKQRLHKATVDQSDPLETTYRCRSGCGPILIVSTPGVVPWEGRGYRLNDWMLRNPTDVTMHPLTATGVVLIPASPHALD